MNENTEARRELEAFRLCYVDGAWAWFTTADLKDQWGDDWNDAPYEHNAGTPYGWHESRKCPPYLLRRVAWEGPLETPDAWTSNSPWSVQDINAGRTPWLVTATYTEFGARLPLVILHAGATLPVFVAAVRAAGGQVYFAHGEDAVLNEEVRG